jgi:hypothetical protein
MEVHITEINPTRCIRATSVSDPDPHSIGRTDMDPDPVPGGLKRAQMKKKRSKKTDN